MSHHASCQSSKSRLRRSLSIVVSTTTSPHTSSLGGPSPDMVSSTGLALFALFRSMRGPLRSIKYALKSIALRCLLLWPHILRKFRDIWSWYVQTSSRDGQRSNGNTIGPSDTGTLRRQEGYICASAVPGQPNLRHSMSGSSNAGGSFHLEPISQPPRTPHSPSSSLSSRSASPQSPLSLLPQGSIHAGTSPYQGAGRARSTTELLVIQQSNTPLPWTHSRATSRQFTGATPLRRPRPPSPFRPRFSRPSTPERLVIDNAPRPGMIWTSQSSPEIPAHPPYDIDVHVQPPSRSATMELNSSVTRSSPSQLSGSSMHGTAPDLHIRIGPQSLESVNSSSGSSLARGSSPAHVIAIQAGPLASPPRLPFPMPHAPTPSIANTSATNAPGSQPNSEKRQIRPMHAEQVSRYVKKGDVPREKSAYTIARLPTDLPHSHRYDLDLEGWIAVTHPGGALHFYHETSNIFTDVYMYNRDLRAEINRFAAHLDEQFRGHGSSLDTGPYDLVLDIVETTDGETIWQYYYVDHTRKTLFWLDPYNMKNLLVEVSGAREPGHIKHRLEALYWVHWSLYPVGLSNRHLPNEAFEELSGVLLSSSIDSLTSKGSTAPYSVAKMQMIRDFMKEAESLGPTNAHAINSVARLLAVFAHWRFIDFHGQKTSRQDRYKSIYKGENHKRTILIKLLSLILFFLPDVHLRELKKVWMDELIIEEVWMGFMQRLLSEWTDFVLYSTVMLATNVAFLAIQGVVVVPQNGPGWIKACPAQIASSVSLVFSVGSIITGLVLIRRNRSMMVEDAKTAWDYLKEMESPCFHLEPLAIIFSLTYALLMWSVWLFFIALLLFSFQNTTTEIQVIVGIFALFVTLLVIWCIVNSWHSDDLKEEGLEDFSLEDTD
ncbi:hypothetical protein BJV78DRAFT_1241392 [Lactifluus subvellereus]|nr:hypothetical protein BJV78DRAFT_1241392 [Lactifluus subvellereus]